MNSKPTMKSWMLSTNVMMIALIAGICIAATTKQAEAQTTASFSETTGWVESFGDAVAQSKRSGKPIMLVFSGSDWCSYCQLLEHEVLRTPEFETWSQANVIKVMVDFPEYHSLSAKITRQNEKLKEYFDSELKGFPTILMIQSNGSVIGKTGYVAGGPMPWIMKADAIVRPSQHQLADTSQPQH